MRRKWIVVTGVVIVAIITGLFFYLRVEKSTDFEPLIKKKLAELVSRGSNGLYILEMESVEIDVLKSTIRAIDVKLHPDSIRMKEMEAFNMLPDDIFEVNLKSLLITGLSPTDFINSKKINVDQVILDTPNVVIYHEKRDYNKASKDTTNFFSRIAPDNQAYTIKDFLLKKMRITYRNKTTGAPAKILNDVTARLGDIRIDSTTAKDSSRFFFAENAGLYLNNYSSLSADKLYRSTIDSVWIDPKNKILKAYQLKVEPQYSKTAFNDKVGYMKERYDFLVKNLVAKNVDWWSLMNGESIHASEIALTGGHINVYLDRSQPGPGKSKVGNYPQQMVMKINKPTNIDLLRINGFFVSYEEFNPKSGQSGTVEFNNAHGTISNITNMQSVIASNPVMRADAHADFMGKAPLHAVFNFNLGRADNGNFSVTAEMGAMNGQHLNEASRGLGLVEIKELEIDKLKAEITGDNNHGNGRVSFAYHDLKIAALKESDKGKLKKRGIVSFLANTFVVKRDGETPPEKYNVTYQRDPYRSFFNVVWQTISLGVIKAVKGK
jgi:hypothetical protein